MSQPSQPIVVDAEQSLNDKYKQRISAEKKTQATLQRMQKDFLGSINAYALVLVLLATVTYAGFLQPPGGSPFGDQPGGEMNKKLATIIFIYFNSSSFYLAVADLLLCVGSSLSPLTSITTWKDDVPVPLVYGGGHVSLQTEQITTKQLSQFVASTLFKLICVNVIFAIALVCCVGAFTAAGFVVTQKGGTRTSVLITSVVGVFFFCIFMVWLLRDTFRFVSKALSDKSLSTSLQNRAGSLQVQFRYLNAVDSGFQ
ncbi:unnamed protein product [Calypogeia fissa]